MTDGVAVATATEKKLLLDWIADTFGPGSVAHGDRTYLLRLEKRFKPVAGQEFSDSDILDKNPRLRKIIIYATERKYEIGRDVLDAEQLKEAISGYMGDAMFNKFFHEKDNRFLDAISDGLSGKKVLPSKDVIEVERILAKAEQRRANERAGVVYFSPSAFSPGSNRSLYVSATCAINFALNRDLGVKGAKGMESPLNRVSGEDVLRVRAEFFAGENSLAGLAQKLRKYKTGRRSYQNGMSTNKNPDDYIPVLESLEKYFANIGPDYIVEGLRYAAPRDLDIPFPGAL